MYAIMLNVSLLVYQFSNFSLSALHQNMESCKSHKKKKNSSSSDDDDDDDNKQQQQTDDCDVMSNFRMISVSSFVFQMKRLVERTVWLSLSTPLNSLS